MPIRPENRDRYPADWPAISLAIRVDRAQGWCECTGQCGRDGHNAGWMRNRCAALHGQPHPITGSVVVLTVAHLDHQPENCDPANLRAMCQRCHLSYDAAHHAETRAASRHQAEQDAGQLLLPLEVCHA